MIHRVCAIIYNSKEYTRAFVGEILRGLFSCTEVTAMPRKAMIPCKHNGCPNLAEVGVGYCEEHSSERPTRASATERGYGYRWRKVRAAYLRKHPLCVKCMADGRYVQATVVDHIQPHRGNPVLMWDESNYQALCKPCHDKKTGHEDSTPEYKY